jgi:hypothetical protein
LHQLVVVQVSQGTFLQLHRLFSPLSSLSTTIS